MCTQQTTEIVYDLQAQANEDMIIQQREATIAAALALPEADRKRLRQLLNEQLRHVDVQKSVVHGSRKNFLIDLAQEWSINEDTTST